MESLRLFSLILLALVVLLSGKTAIPLIIFAFRPGALRLSFDDSAAAQWLLSNPGDLADWLHNLKELGFSLLGIKVEKLPLWGPPQREVALVSQTGEAYASIVLHPDGKPASLYFYTPFKDGGMVFTRNYEPAPEAEEKRLSVKNVPSQDFKEVLASHESRLGVLKEKGFIPMVGINRQAKIEATHAFYASEYAHRPGFYLTSPIVLGFLLSILLFFGGLIWLR